MLEQCETRGLERVRASARQADRDPGAYLNEVVRYAYARLGSREEAEDVAMEVWQAAFRFRSEIPKKQDPELYLIGITRRKIADHLRRRTRERGPATESLDGPNCAEAAAPESESLMELMQALETLPELQRDVLILKYLLGFSTQEVATLIRKSTQAANSLLQRARESLAQNAPYLMPGIAGERKLS